MENIQFRFPLTQLLSKDLENKFFDVTILWKFGELFADVIDFSELCFAKSNVVRPCSGNVCAEKTYA